MAKFSSKNNVVSDFDYHLDTYVFTKNSFTVINCAGGIVDEAYLRNFPPYCSQIGGDLTIAGKDGEPTQLLQAYCWSTSSTRHQNTWKIFWRLENDALLLVAKFQKKNAMAALRIVTPFSKDKVVSCVCQWEELARPYLSWYAIQKQAENKNAGSLGVWKDNSSEDLYSFTFCFI